MVVHIGATQRIQLNDVNARHDGGEICRAVSSIAARQHQHAPHVEDCELRSQRVVLDGRTRPIALPPPAKAYSNKISWVVLPRLTAETARSCTAINIRCDTIRDAILTCARKPIWVSLIYRTETTTKRCKTEKKLRSKKRACSEVTVKVWGIHVGLFSPEEEKDRLRAYSKRVPRTNCALRIKKCAPWISSGIYF